MDIIVTEFVSIDNKISNKNYRLAVNSFSAEAERLQMDLTADSEDSRRLQTQLKRWDRKKKKMVTVSKVISK